jgi:Fe-S cluster assembly iron-binding protein IscA
VPAYVELQYDRPADERPVTLLAELPTVRPVDVGGAPDGLRLPNCPVDTHYATILPGAEGFSIERSQAAEPRVLVNDEPLGTVPRPLAAGDVIQVDGYKLLFHDSGEIDEERLIETQHRWRQRLPDGIRGDGDDAPADESTPYIKEFELSVRPMANSDQHDEVERKANAELMRLIRTDEADRLERYCRFLWSLRIAALSRGGRQPEAEEASQHAIDLYPHDASLLVWLGIAQLKKREWKAAARNFGRCLRVCPRGELRILHLARLGVRLASDEIFNDDLENGGYRRAIKPHSDDWNVPELVLDAPGDEIFYWYLVRTARLFGSEESVQFRYLGNIGDEAGAEGSGATDRTAIRQRWEIFDRAGAKLHRRIIRLPAVAYADPSLLVEGALIRHHLAQQDSNWMHGVIDLSDDDKSVRRSPVIFDQSAIDDLVKAVSEQTPFVRMMRRGEDRLGFQLSLVAAPQPDDVVYEQGALKVAVCERDVELLAGARLTRLRERDGESFCLESPNFPRVPIALPLAESASKTTGGAPPHRRALQITAAVLAGAAIVILLVLALT